MKRLRHWRVGRALFRSIIRMVLLYASPTASSLERGPLIPRPGRSISVLDTISPWVTAGKAPSPPTTATPLPRTIRSGFTRRTLPTAPACSTYRRRSAALTDLIFCFGRATSPWIAIPPKPCSLSPGRWSYVALPVKTQLLGARAHHSFCAGRPSESIRRVRGREGRRADEDVKISADFAVRAIAPWRRRTARDVGDRETG